MRTSHRRNRGGRITLLAAGICLLTATPAVADQLTLVSRAGGPAGLKGNGDSWGESLSADGRRVAFTSRATNLHRDDADSVPDVYVRDLATNGLVLVSRAAGSSGAKGNGAGASLSADGRYVAFGSGAQLHPDDHDSAPDVYVRDLVTGSMTLVSRATGATGAKGNGSSFDAAISADGARVVFLSQATNLDPDDTDILRDAYVRDLASGTTTLVSRASGTGPKGDRSATLPVISGDGSAVAFQSSAGNLIAGDDDGYAANVFARDLTTGELVLVSRAAGPAGEKVEGGLASISHDGTRVTFSSDSPVVHPDDTDHWDDVFLRDLDAATTTLVSRANGAAGADADSHSLNGRISAGGRFVAFHSFAGNLDPDDPVEDVLDVYVRDTLAGTTTLASRGSDPVRQPGNAHSYWSAVSQDGLLAMFTSNATNLHPEDVDGGQDVYVRELGDARDCDVFRITARVGGGESLRACF